MAAAHVRDVRVREVADELLQGVGLPSGVRVGEGKDLAAALPHRIILGRHLAATWDPQQPDALVAGRERGDDRVGGVRRRIGDDDDPETVRGVVEREQVLEPPPDHGLLVVRRHDEGDGRLDVMVQTGRRCVRASAAVRIG